MKTGPNLEIRDLMKIFYFKWKIFQIYRKVSCSNIKVYRLERKKKTDLHQDKFKNKF